jgi:hypothetical protein
MDCADFGVLRLAAAFSPAPVASLSPAFNGLASPPCPKREQAPALQKGRGDPQWISPALECCGLPPLSPRRRSQARRQLATASQALRPKREQAPALQKGQGAPQWISPTLECCGLPPLSPRRRSQAQRQHPTASQAPPSKAGASSRTPNRLCILHAPKRKVRWPRSGTGIMMERSKAGPRVESACGGKRSSARLGDLK